jgi:hypothetical protein
MGQLAKLLASRPTEAVASAAGILAAALVVALHADPKLTAPLALALGHLPALVTFVVEYRTRQSKPKA